jgi:hypothetical protein
MVPAIAMLLNDVLSVSSSYRANLSSKIFSIKILIIMCGSYLHRLSSDVVGFYVVSTVLAI